MDFIMLSWSSPTTDLFSFTESHKTFATRVTKSTWKSSVTNELFQGYSDALLKLASTVCIVFTVVGIPGNLITVMALHKCSRVRNATAVFIINLSLSDLLFCCFNLPLAASTFLHRSWNHGELLCRLFPWMRYGLLAVSLFSILSITINRYIMIGHPRLYPRIYRNKYLALIVATTWVGPFSILIPTYRGVWGSFGLDTKIGSCSILPDKHGNSPKEFFFILAFVVPCLCILVCYARIFYIVRKTGFRSRDPTNMSSSIHLAPVANKVLEGSKCQLQLSFINAEISIVKGQKERQLLPRKQSQINSYLSIGDYELKYIDESVESNLSGSFLTLPDSPTKTCGTTSYKPEDGCEGKNIFDGYGNKNRQEKRESQALQDIFVTREALNTNEINMENAEPKINRKLKNKSGVKTSTGRMPKFGFHNSSTVNTSNASSLYPGRMSLKDKRLLKMIMVIFLSFIICYLPITITKLWKESMSIQWLNISGYLLIYLTTCINPFVYVVMSSEYRLAYLNLLRCTVGKSKKPLEQDEGFKINNPPEQINIQ